MSEHAIDIAPSLITTAAWLVPCLSLARQAAPPLRLSPSFRRRQGYRSRAATVATTHDKKAPP
ncbi:hypothetical protein [Acetobacter fallax]|uniref:Uncharacterized protein n=1 Tax=Acetobacter fallax TaxID=1737473 RepID=A0ABX0KG10_9PROT|nr:hypothetical protein [Acetobacter fallax]NHO33360.1 hypothetical protein [Acetobacter fallax]NHO36980.1 hypothetical protein [Acetobacter fallax]